MEKEGEEKKMKKEKNKLKSQVDLLANELKVNVVDSQDFLLASGARVCKSCNCKKTSKLNSNTRSFFFSSSYNFLHRTVEGGPDYKHKLIHISLARLES